MTDPRNSQWDAEQKSLARIAKDSEKAEKENTAGDGYAIDGVNSDASLNEYGTHGRHTQEPTEQERSDGRYDSEGRLKDEGEQPRNKPQRANARTDRK